MFLKNDEIKRNHFQVEAMVMQLSKRKRVKRGLGHGDAIYAKRIKRFLIGRLSEWKLQRDPGSLSFPMKSQ